MNLKQAVLLFSALLFVVSGCVEHNIPADKIDCRNSADISFLTDVKSLVIEKCATSGCHDGSLGEERNWKIFSRFQAKAPNVRDRITRPPGTSGHMPLTGSLSDLQIQTIVCWVEQGANDN